MFLIVLSNRKFTKAFGTVHVTQTWCARDWWKHFLSLDTLHRGEGGGGGGHIWDNCAHNDKSMKPYTSILRAKFHAFTTMCTIIPNFPHTISAISTCEKTTWKFSIGKNIWRQFPHTFAHHIYHSRRKYKETMKINRRQALLLSLASTELKENVRKCWKKKKKRFWVRRIFAER